MDKLSYKLKSGKNSKFLYYLAGYARLLAPKTFVQARLKSTLDSLDAREDREYITERVDYYNRLTEKSAISENAPMLREYWPTGQKVYFFDMFQYARWFPQSLRLELLPGDITYVPQHPSIVKSRPLHTDNANSVIMKLDKVRHFIFVKDPIRFSDKKDMVIFRGKVKGKESRRRFMKLYFGNAMCDLGDVSRDTTDPEEWQTEKKSIRDHLEYKFIMALEGNDVASNLKWVMSSNSVAVMPRPTCETWFMEGKLIPDYHYIEIRPDFSDLEERLRYYIAHPEEAERIARNANEYVAQFKDRKRERLISLLVLDKYFRMTGGYRNAAR